MEEFYCKRCFGVPEVIIKDEDGFIKCRKHQCFVRVRESDMDIDNGLIMAQQKWNQDILIKSNVRFVVKLSKENIEMSAIVINVANLLLKKHMSKMILFNFLVN